MNAAGAYAVPADFVGAPPASRTTERRVALRVAMVVLLLSTTVFSRFGLNLGSYSLNVALVAVYGVLVVALFSGALQASLQRLCLYILCVGVAGLSLGLNASLGGVERASFASFALLAVMYLPFPFVLRENSLASDDCAWLLRAFSNVALFSAIAGIVQFYAQFVIHASWLFDFTPLIPEVLRGPTGYNTVIPVGALYKSNGFFFREPSGFSLIMALAIFVEWLTTRRTRRMACFAFALLLSYSGTGILALLLGMLFPLGKRTILRFLALACLGGLVIYTLGDALNLSFTIKRIEEFGSERSSAYIRYIAPLRLVADTIGAEPWTAWFGHGPGTIFREVRPYEFHDPTWAKLLFEYGVVGFVLFLALFLLVLRSDRVPIQVRATLFFAWLVMGGHLLSPEQNFLTLALVGFIRFEQAVPFALERRR